MRLLCWVPEGSYKAFKGCFCPKRDLNADRTTLPPLAPVSGHPQGLAELLSKVALVFPGRARPGPSTWSAGRHAGPCTRTFPCPGPGEPQAVRAPDGGPSWWLDSAFRRQSGNNKRKKTNTRERSQRKTKIQRALALGRCDRATVVASARTQAPRHEPASRRLRREGHQPQSPRPSADLRHPQKPTPKKTTQVQSLPDGTRNRARAGWCPLGGASRPTAGACGGCLGPRPHAGKLQTPTKALGPTGNPGLLSKTILLGSES